MGNKPISCKPQDILENGKKIVQDSQIDLLGYFKTVLQQCFKADGVKKSAKTSAPTKRKKRRPSGYNLFIGACMKKGKGMGECAGKWKSADKEKWNAKAKQR